ncbi:MFS transporter [Flavitalea sp. BT771]|uniref:MFS transporter n=1 Tax=Flavitalea sp. BT771 TaxID=3063329 RepID=UPI0026E19F75|nr:MFS transporter [Flavitalea sp. BT771]MDO6433975.1 MFS transporter [Flavitalea sp. BT771]MDV6222875.1 MFS transporter [Flavitalea sp. BT771]
MEGDCLMQTAGKKVINGWAMYDWANSVYNLVITTTFFPIYFTAATKKHFGSENIPFLGRTFINSSLYDYSLAAAYLLIALAYPILTSIADTRGNKKIFMQVFCYMGAIGCSMLFTFNGGNLGSGVFFFILASLGYTGSLVFYNSYLPEIAAPADQDRVSAKGYAYGYVGSVLLQIIGFVLVLILEKKDPFLGPQLTFLLVGLWWAGFAQLTFRVLPKSSQPQANKVNVFSAGFIEIKKVYGQVKKMAVLKRFLRGFFFYSMGVQTVMLAATLFGSKLLGLEDTKLIVTVVLIQLVAIVGATWMSRLSAKYGNIRVLMGVVLFWIVICISAYITAGLAGPLKPYHERIALLQQEQAAFKVRKDNAAKMDSAAVVTALDAAEGKVEAELSRVSLTLAPKQTPIEYSFYALALAVGLVMGGIQSLSRSTYSKLMPETKDTASFFSYYDLTEKIAIVIGMFTFGFLEERTGSMKNSILFLVVFFAIGLIWLYSALVKQRKEQSAVAA